VEPWRTLPNDVVVQYARLKIMTWSYPVHYLIRALIPSIHANFSMKHPSESAAYAVFPQRQRRPHADPQFVGRCQSILTCQSLYNNYMVVSCSIFNLGLELICTGEYHRALAILTIWLLRCFGRLWYSLSTAQVKPCEIDLVFHRPECFRIRSSAGALGFRKAPLPFGV